MEGIVRLHEAVKAGVPPAYELRSVAVVSELSPDARGRARACVERARAAPRDDASSSSPRSSSRRRRTCATRRASTSSPTSPRSTTSAGATRGVSGYIGTPAGRDLNAPMTQGYQAVPLPKPKRFAMNYHLLAIGSRPRRVRLQTWVDEGEAVPTVIEVWPTADWHEREAWDLMGDRDRRPPEPEADPPRRRLGGPPAAQGLPARRRARALLGRGVAVAVAPSRPRAPRADLRGLRASRSRSRPCCTTSPSSRRRAT